MLDELEIRNLGPIRHAVLATGAGMTAITGETGAGKSMLLDALRLVSGAAVQSGRASSAAQQDIWAQAVFAVQEDSAAYALAKDAGTTDEDGELYLTRSIPAHGRSRALLNGHTVPRTVLKDISEQMVTIHGQSDQMRMASAARQREFLDRFADDGEELARYTLAWDALRAIDGKLKALDGEQAATRAQATYLRESIERIDAVEPHAGEDEELKSRRDRIENAAAIAHGVASALTALDPSQMDVDAQHPGALSLIDDAARSLEDINIHEVFGESAQTLKSLSQEISDVVFTLSGQIDEEDSAADLDTINGRIHELDELTKRWGPSLSDVLAWRDKAENDMQDMDASPERLASLRAERDDLYRRALTAADALSHARQEAAGRLGRHVGEELGALAMRGSKLDVVVSSRHRGAGESEGILDAHGCDDIEFLFTAFPGSPRLPMGKSASGGELSRLMLALELVAADRSTTGHEGASNDGVFIFDEVDAGVGGKAAVELGRRLALLAKSAQVIVVTHLPQVASWADTQFVVSKGMSAAGDAGSGSDAGAAADEGDQVQGIETIVEEVQGVEREREIARMLAGSESETSLRHARELLQSSRIPTE
ncbi:DNA repair protein RecN [Bifidobacterium psychraerophilum]|jgi:DNA repair protein RecN (Recombination protein N)|uniref:DNA repair protein RecN n=1 Tax=Bifidobacterium psychraerophilum TaxID=218140 RepID=UPI0023F17C78|nr:DNA repair protein RecN [Bifidobacterium psychraerophilum]MCI1661105.1 DNA repair protein RecN [Bifidobacterium psychraerophilum]MCI1803962.1 DNA repair protein RecN [Bifidobacterium psychraerophilum]MCI2175740.1 DNA repair protein RecN [Bifidobacterium psychraerophilum]MCI2181746.1 DNA repair protein RecN [Bifidobacterium psychraerophilum]